MKIKLLSDLHHEFQRKKKATEPEYFKYDGEDVLILAGDIASGSTNTIGIIKKFRDNGFENIVYVPGNHEYYGTTVPDFDNKMLAKCVGKAHFLNPGHIIIEDTVFIGATLWTNFRNDHFARMTAKDMISDFNLINDFTTGMPVVMFDKHFEYIKHTYELYPELKKVIVTHFLPAIECISPRFQRDNLINKYFANDLGNWIGNIQNTTWVFGHTHDSVDIMIGDTRMLCNPYGYYPNAINPEFKHNFTFR